MGLPTGPSLIDDLGTLLAVFLRRLPILAVLGLAGMASSPLWAPMPMWIPAVAVAATIALRIPWLPQVATRSIPAVAVIVALAAGIAVIPPVDTGSLPWVVADAVSSTVCLVLAAAAARALRAPPGDRDAALARVVTACHRRPWVTVVAIQLIDPWDWQLVAAAAGAFDSFLNDAGLPWGVGLLAGTTSVVPACAGFVLAATLLARGVRHAMRAIVGGTLVVWLVWGVALWITPNGDGSTNIAAARVIHQMEFGALAVGASVAWLLRLVRDGWGGRVLFPAVLLLSVALRCGLATRLTWAIVTEPGTFDRMFAFDVVALAIVQVLLVVAAVASPFRLRTLLVMTVAVESIATLLRGMSWDLPDAALCAAAISAAATPGWLLYVIATRAVRRAQGIGPPLTANAQVGDDDDDAGIPWNAQPKSPEV